MFFPLSIWIWPTFYFKQILSSWRFKKDTSSFMTVYSVNKFQMCMVNILKQKNRFKRHYSCWFWTVQTKQNKNKKYMEKRNIQNWCIFFVCVACSVRCTTYLLCIYLCMGNSCWFVEIFMHKRIIIRFELWSFASIFPPSRDYKCKSLWACFFLSPVE